jgi:hypothetical protein
VSLDLLSRCVGSAACLKAIHQQLVAKTGGAVLPAHCSAGQFVLLVGH